MPTDPRIAELPGFVLLRDKLPRLHDEIDRLVASSVFGVRPSGPALDQMAGFIELAELGAFVQAVDLFYEKHPWPRTTVISLLQNPRLSRKELLDGDRYSMVYRNAVQQLDEILQYKHLWAAHGSASDLMATIVSQPAFSRLDGSTVHGLVFALKNQADQESLAEAEFALLLAIDWTRNASPAITLADLVAQRMVEPAVAVALLQKIVETTRYPFFQIDLLAHVLESVPENTFRGYLLGPKTSNVPSPSLDKLLLHLAQTNPHAFANLFLRHRSTFKKKFQPTGMFSSEKEIYRICWGKIGLWDKIMATFFPG
ncbi:MAG: hypothetical protein WCO25_02520 [Candidatus Uhrbacteria bacterium]